MSWRLRRSRLARVAAVLLLGTIYSLVSMASHHNQGHQDPVLYIFPGFKTWNLPAKTLLGQSLTVSNFPNSQIPQVSQYLNDGIADWNNHLRNNGPSSLSFNVLTRTSDNNSSADILVKVYENYTVCDDDNPGVVACAYPPQNYGQGEVRIIRPNYVLYGSTYQKYVLVHELGHAFAQLNDHYGTSLNCSSVMGDSCQLHPTSHDNDDVYDVYRQNGLVVASNYIKRILGSYKAAWEPLTWTDPEDKQHGESNFIIDRSTGVGGELGGTFSLYSLSSRNSIEMDGKDRFGNPVGPATISLQGGDHWCFRVRTENFTFPTGRGEHYGNMSSSDCIARSDDGKKITSTTYKTNQVYVNVYNDGNSTINNLQVRYGYYGNVACTPTQTTLSPGEATSCSFDSSDVKWWLQIWYNGSQQDIVYYDSYASN